MVGDIKDALIEIVGRQNFTDALIDLVSYSYDASDHNHRPDAAVRPTETAQVSLILKMADKHNPTDNQPLPVGFSDFRELRESGCYYVDKSLFIKKSPRHRQKCC